MCRTAAQEASRIAAPSATIVAPVVDRPEAVEAVPQSPEVSEDTNGSGLALEDPKIVQEEQPVAASLLEASAVPQAAAAMPEAVPRGGTQGPLLTDAEAEPAATVAAGDEGTAEGPGEEAKKPGVPNLLGTAALMGVAGLVATTLAVDLTDAALVGALVAAGGTATSPSNKYILYILYMHDLDVRTMLDAGRQQCFLAWLSIIVS